LIGGLGLILVQIWELIKRIKLFWNFGKDGKLPKINLSGRIWEPPSEIDPAQVEQLINGTKTISPNSSTATILSLVGGGYYRIERSQKKEGFIFKKYHYFLIKTEKEVKLSSIQEAVVRLLDNVFGKENKIDLKDIGKWTKKHTEKTRKFLTETWPEVVKRENIKEGFFDRMADKKLKDYISPLHVGVAVIMVIVIILASTIGQILLIPILIFPLVVAIISIIIMAGLKSYGLKRTEKGKLETAGWLAFKKHLKEYKKTIKEPIDSIVMWQKYLIYGAALGVSIKTLSEIPLDLSQQDQMILVNHWGGSIDGGNLNAVESLNSIGEAIESVSNSISEGYGAAGVVAEVAVAVEPAEIICREDKGELRF